MEQREGRIPDVSAILQYPIVIIASVHGEEAAEAESKGALAGWRAGMRGAVCRRHANARSGRISATAFIVGELDNVEEGENCKILTLFTEREMRGYHWLPFARRLFASTAASMKSSRNLVARIFMLATRR